MFSFLFTVGFLWLMSSVILVVALAMVSRKVMPVEEHENMVLENAA
jgi:hypothetical protein